MVRCYRPTAAYVARAMVENLVASGAGELQFLFVALFSVVYAFAHMYLGRVPFTWGRGPWIQPGTAVVRAGRDGRRLPGAGAAARLVEDPPA